MNLHISLAYSKRVVYNVNYLILEILSAEKRRRKGKKNMDNLTRIIRSEISKQYRSVRQFAFAVGVPLSTVNSALHNGVGGSSFDTVLQICKALGIKALGDDAAFYLTENTEELLTRYAMLDDYGRHTIDAVMRVEYERCTQQDEPEMGRGSVNI